MRNEKEFDVVKALELARACIWAFDTMSFKEVVIGSSPLNVLHDSALKELVSLYERYKYVQLFDMETGEPINKCITLSEDKWEDIFIAISNGLFPYAIHRYSYRDGFEADTQEEIAKHVVEVVNDKTKFLTRPHAKGIKFCFWDKMKDAQISSVVVVK